MTNKDWKDCCIAINFPDSKTLNLFAQYVGKLPEYMETWSLDEEEMEEIKLFAEVMKSEGEVTISSPLIDRGDEKTLFGMEMFVKTRGQVNVSNFSDYMKRFWSAKGIEENS